MEKQEPGVVKEPSGISALQVRVERTGDQCRVTVAGDVDLATTTQLRDAVRAVMNEGERPRRLIINLCDVGFMDSAGLALLVDIRNDFGDSEPIYLVVEPRGQAERILKLGHFDKFFHLTHQAGIDA